jgi:hypothetical protein
LSKYNDVDGIPKKCVFEEFKVPYSLRKLQVFKQQDNLQITFHAPVTDTALIRDPCDSVYSNSHYHYGVVYHC